MIKLHEVSFVVSGFAAVIVVSSLLYTRNHAVPLEDRVRNLEAQNETLKTELRNTEREVMLTVANRMEELCVDLGGSPEKCGAGPEAEGAAVPFPEELIRQIGTPAKTANAKGAQFTTKVPVEVLKAVLENVAMLAAEVSIAPTAKDGRPEGFQLFEIREGGLAPAVGFQQGDVIRKVNDMPFTSTEQVVQVYDKLTGATRIVFDVAREGKDVTIVVEAGT